ncbi:MAG: PEGA domain-containing protein [Sandaracinaceae bacterium]|nr:PEGA domain-containing protein [Sandaracinaceae bacterium]
MRGLSSSFSALAARPFYRGLATLTVLFACLVAVPAGAHAQARAGAAERAREAEARALFEQGREHAEAERWIEALDSFRRSRAVSERPTTIFNIATTLIRLGRAQEALATIAELERLADPTQHARILSDAAEIRRQAEASLRHVTVRVSPVEATVEVDGELVAGEGAERTMVLDPGAHAVVVSAEGHVTQRFNLEPGSDQREIALAQLDATLHVVPSVDTATVSVDGAVRGTGALELTLAPGSYAIGITAEGYLPFDRRVDLGAGATLTVDAALELIPPDTDITHSSLFWGLTLGLGGALVLGGIITAAVCASSDACWVDGPLNDGSSDVIIAPLASF